MHEKWKQQPKANATPQIRYDWNYIWPDRDKLRRCSIDFELGQIEDTEMEF